MRWLPARRLCAGRASRTTLLAAGLILLLGGCVTAPPVTPPGGFAVYDEQEVVRAVSPEGVRYLVRYADNDPQQNLAFWREALALHLERSGYAARAEQQFDAPAGEGVLFEWVAPVGEEDWVYLTAVVPDGDRLIVAEVAGPVEMYACYQTAIRRSLESIGGE
jgi:hypothetical protein